MAAAKRKSIAARRCENESVGEIIRSLLSPFPIPSRSDLSTSEIQRLAACSNLPRRHERNYDTRSGYAPDVSKTASIREWEIKRDKIVSLAGSGFMLTLLGPRGTGKTQLAVDAMLHRFAIGSTALYVKSMEIFLWIRSTYRDNDSKTCEFDAIGDFLAPSLLIIDEISERGETDFEDRMLLYILDKRYDAMLDTIMIGNAKSDEFKASMSPSIIDRMIETGGITECNWKSFRTGDNES